MGTGLRSYLAQVAAAGFETPSPVHSSDSEETWGNKLEWQRIARGVWRRWRAFVNRRRAERWLRIWVFRSVMAKRNIVMAAVKQDGMTHQGQSEVGSSDDIGSRTTLADNELEEKLQMEISLQEATSAEQPTRPRRDRRWLPQAPGPQPFI